MADEPQLELELLDQRPQQFGLIHLMGLMTVLALAFALLTPLFRATSGVQNILALVVLMVPILFIAGPCVISAVRRHQILAVAGRRVGKNKIATANSRKTWQAAEAIALLILSITLVAFELWAICFFVDSFPTVMIISQALVGWFASQALMQLRWNRDFGTIEFFENGMVMASFYLIPWEKLTVRQCKLSEQSVNIHFPTEDKYGGSAMLTVAVSDELKHYLMKHHGEEAS